MFQLNLLEIKIHIYNNFTIKYKYDTLTDIFVFMLQVDTF